MRLRFYGFFAAALLFAAIGHAAATPSIVIDVATGDVLYQDHAAQQWYPASLTKLMTVYVALSAVRDHHITLDTPLVVSARAASMPPSKMGFKPGTEVTLGNALKMLMVKSPNDIAVTVAEGIAGSVDAFAEDMNAAAAQLGMKQSHFVNPNGLHNPDHFSSARDLAILARAIYLTFPQSAELFNIGTLRLGDQIIPNHNDLLGRYPGADGMKTGFTCDSGFNLVASATRNNHHYIAVVLGAPSVRSRLVRVAVLLDRAFDGIDRPQTTSADDDAGGAPEDMRGLVCRRRGKAVAAFEAETARLEAPLTEIGQAPAQTSPFGTLFNASALAREAPVALRIAMVPAPVFDPTPVYVGPAPGYSGPVAQVRPPHSPVGTAPETEPTAAATATPDKPPAAEPDEDSADTIAVDDHEADKPATADKPEKKQKHAARHHEASDDADSAPAKAKKHVTKAAAAKTHASKKIAAKEHRGKTKVVKAGKEKTTLHKAAKGNPAKVAKAKASKAAAKKSKPAKLAAKPHHKHVSASAGQ